MYPYWWIYPDLIDNIVERSIPSYDRFSVLRPANGTTIGIVCWLKRKWENDWMFRILLIYVVFEWNLHGNGLTKMTIVAVARHCYSIKLHTANESFQWMEKNHRLPFSNQQNTHLNACTRIKLVKSCNSTNAFRTCSLKSFFSPK